jgi:hypothetical protein
MAHSKHIHEKQYSNFTESNKQHNILIGHIKSQILLKMTLKHFCLYNITTFIGQILQKTVPIPVSQITARLESARHFDNRKEKS